MLEAVARSRLGLDASYGYDLSLLGLADVHL